MRDCKPTLETAQLADRRELLDMLAAAFRTDTPTLPEFDALYPDVFIPTPEAMARHRIIRQNGRIVACVGHYPMELRLGAVSLPLFGIGQVSCQKEYRGQGFMTALLKDAIALMEASPTPLSWLGGRRDRYARFGWEVGGTAFRCKLNAKALAPAPKGYAIVSNSPEAISDDTWHLYASEPLRCIFAKEEWLRKLTRGKPQTVWTATQIPYSPPLAFAVTQQESENILEYGGERNALHALLATIAQTRGANGTVTLTCCPKVTPLSEFLWTHSEWVTPEFSNIRIHHLGKLLDAYAPFWRPCVPKGEGATLVMLRHGTPCETAVLGEGGEWIEMDELQMVRLLFGPWPPSFVLDLPERSRWLAHVLPLPFALPVSSHV